MKVLLDNSLEKELEMLVYKLKNHPTDAVSNNQLVWKIKNVKLQIQVRNLMDPIIRQKMLEPAPQIIMKCPHNKDKCMYIKEETK